MSTIVAVSGLGEETVVSVDGESVGPLKSFAIGVDAGGMSKREICFVAFGKETIPTAHGGITRFKGPSESILKKLVSAGFDVFIDMDNKITLLASGKKK